MSAIGNFLWFIMGGAIMGLAWWLLGILAFITIVGIQHLKLAGRRLVGVSAQTAR